MLGNRFFIEVGLSSRLLDVYVTFNIRSMGQCQCLCLLAIGIASPSKTTRGNKNKVCYSYKQKIRVSFLLPWASDHDHLSGRQKALLGKSSNTTSLNMCCLLA